MSYILIRVACLLLQYDQMARFWGNRIASQAWLVVAGMDASSDSESEGVFRRTAMVVEDLMPRAEAFMITGSFLWRK